MMEISSVVEDFELELEFPAGLSCEEGSEWFEVLIALGEMN